MIRFFAFLLTFVSFSAFAHGPGEDDHASAPSSHDDRHTAVAVSDKYEYVLMYTHADAGDPSSMTLYVNEFDSNRPVRAKSLSLSLAGKPVQATPGDSGIYSFKAVSAKGLSLKVALEGPLGPDLVLLDKLDPTVEPAGQEVAAPAEAKPLPGWLWAVGGLVVGGIVVLLLLRGGAKARRAAAATLLLTGLTQAPNTIAHEEPSAEAPKGRKAADGSFAIAKDAQFIFGLRTARVAQGGYAPSDKVFGTIVPSPQGQARVVSPISGAILRLNVQVGEEVDAGEVLAVVEQVLDAQTRAQLEADRNSINAELTAAKAEYERLQTVQDIAAARDVAEAKARYERARKNAALYQHTLAGAGRTVTLKSPIRGVVQNFSAAPGQIVEPGQSVMTVTDLNRVLVEAQVFDRQMDAFSEATRFRVQCADPSREHVTGQVKLLSLGQAVNPTNQSRRVLFEVINKEQDFKLGEFVNVEAFAPAQVGVISVPASALSELDGRPVVFIKTAPETFKPVYVQPGSANSSSVAITRGLFGGERVVTTAAFQARMIYQQ